MKIPCFALVVHKHNKVSTVYAETGRDLVFYLLEPISIYMYNKMNLVTHDISFWRTIGKHFFFFISKFVHIYFAAIQQASLKIQNIANISKVTDNKNTAILDLYSATISYPKKRSELDKKFLLHSIINFIVVFHNF